MSTLIYKAKYRPVRVGWCVREGDFAALKRAFQLSHCLWGGRFNPVVDIDQPHDARRLIDQYQVDVLLPAVENEECAQFMSGFPHLAPPFPADRMFAQMGEQLECTYLDIHHPVRSFYKADELPEDILLHERLTLFKWAPDHPLDLVLNAMIGTYPCDVGVDYYGFIQHHPATDVCEVLSDERLIAHVISATTPSLITCAMLRSDPFEPNHGPGLYLGNPASFQDLVQYWNLRALNITLFFYDRTRPERFAYILPDLHRLIARGSDGIPVNRGRLEIWSETEPRPEELTSIGGELLVHRGGRFPWWRREGTRAQRYFPMHWLEERSLMSQVSEADQPPSATLQLGTMPGAKDGDRGFQRLIVALTPSYDISRDDRHVFRIPNVSELSPFLNFKAAIGHPVRATKDGLALFIALWDDTVFLQAIHRYELAKAVFRVAGIDAEPSAAGLVCEQLVRQMGGLQGCRVFKIAGVRALIEAYDATQSFERTAAMGLIRDLRDGQAHFDTYHGLHLEPGGQSPLKPDDAFRYLLKREVFRAGLELECPSCRLRFWRTLDDSKSRMTCEFCGKEFNSTVQLKDRNWAYRPSGLFGRRDHQEGGVPVTLVLQQLEIIFHGQWITWLPALSLNSSQAGISPCEADFAILMENPEGRVQLVLGECKTRKEITDADVQNLVRVAQRFDPERFDVFLVFAKTAEFEAAEIARCAPARSMHERTILLSQRELEPYQCYERAAAEFDVDPHIMSLDDMVRATRGIYFSPRPKTIRPPIEGESSLGP